MPVDHYEGEDVIITLERNGASTVENVEGKITAINVSGGEENTEVKYAFGNKQILFSKPKDKFKVNLDVIVTDGTFPQAFLGGSSKLAGVDLKSSNTQDSWRIIVWFVPFSEQISSGSIYLPPKTSSNLGRWIFVDCKTVSFERKFESDDMLTGTISFEFSATDPIGYANFFEGYTNSTTTALNVMQISGATTAEYRGALSWNTTTPAWTGAYST